MTLIDHLLLFAATFSNVFLLGFNSKNIHQSRYVSAFIVSWGITIAQYFFVRYAAHNGGLEFIMISGLGGSLGIVTAIFLHDCMHGNRNVTERR